MPQNQCNIPFLNCQHIMLHTSICLLYMVVCHLKSHVAILIYSSWWGNWYTSLNILCMVTAHLKIILYHLFYINSYIYQNNHIKLLQCPWDILMGVTNKDPWNTANVSNINCQHVMPYTDVCLPHKQLHVT